MGFVKLSWEFKCVRTPITGSPLITVQQEIKIEIYLFYLSTLTPL